MWFIFNISILNLYNKLSYITYEGVARRVQFLFIPSLTCRRILRSIQVIGPARRAALLLTGRYINARIPTRASSSRGNLHEYCASPTWFRRQKLHTVGETYTRVCACVITVHVSQFGVRVQYHFACEIVEKKSRNVEYSQANILN